MADFLRVYRRFYHIHVGVDQTSSYALIDPYSLTTTVRNISEGGTVVEATATVVNTTVGEYYADLNVPLYSSGSIYEIDWLVGYTAGSSTKHLYTRFVFPAVLNPGAGVIRELDIELVNELPITVTVEKHDIIYSIIPNTP